MTIATVFDRSDAELLEAAAAYEQRFDVRFDTFVFFDTDLLADLHTEGPLPPAMVQASAADEQVTGFVETITQVANLPVQTDRDRARYLQALEDIYRRLAVSPVDAARAADLVIAPQREGRILAERLGCLPAKASWLPQAKRIAVDGGLMVGFDTHPGQPVAGRVAVIDGVIASGATLMAALQLGVAPGASVEVFTCHSTAAGVVGLARYATRLGQQLILHVGHVSGRLNDRFYAVDPADPGRLVLGDVGDTISDIAGEQGTRR